MNREFQQYRFARIEARNITRGRLEAQFRDGFGNLEEIEKAIEQLITTEPTCTPWRTSEIEQLGALAGLLPVLPVLAGLPFQRHGTFLLGHLHVVEVGDLRMAGLNLPQAALDLRAIL